MAKTPKPAAVTETTAPIGAWLALQDGWYCGQLMTRGQPVTHVSAEQLAADDGQRVVRADSDDGRALAGT